MLKQTDPIPKKIVLLGGGHSNLQVLHSLARINRSLFKLTLISDVLASSYSGMIPSFLAGVYKQEELQFDLKKICDRFGFEFIQEKAKRIDTSKNQIQTASGKTVYYDICSVNIGIIPTLIPSIEASENDVIYLKPISNLINKWQQLSHRAETSAERFHFSIVGGGAGAFEVAIACRRKFRWPDYKIRLITGKGGLLADHNQTTQNYARQSLKKFGIELLEGVRVDRIEKDQLILSDNSRIEKQICFIGTSAQAPEIFRTSGLPVNVDGFVTVDDRLFISNLKNIFASGDCCHFSQHPLQKSGVFAVRQGPVLVANITQLILGKTNFKKYNPQSHFLTILVSGNNRAIASYKNFAFEGRIPWLLKDFIDKKFMRTFQ